MLKNNKKRVFFIFILAAIVSACGGSEKGSQTQQFIDQVKTQTKPTVNKNVVGTENLEALLKTQEGSIENIKARNPFSLAAAPVATTAAGGQASGSLKLLGIFTLGASGREKRWAILSFDGKIYRVTAGEKVGENRISQVNVKSVTVTSNENGEETSYTLSLQEQKK